MQLLLHNVFNNKHFFTFIFCSRILGDKTKKPPPYTRDNRYFKYKPDCSGLSKNDRANQLVKADEKNKKVFSNHEENRKARNESIILAEIICHGNCKCHPNC